MRILSILLLLIMTSMFFVSCDKVTKTEDTSTTDPVTVVPSGDDDDDDGGGGGGGGGTTTGGCTGTTSDGVGEGSAIFQQDMLLAGHQTWVPGTYSDPLATQTMPSVQNAMLLFRTDSRLKVRFKINSQPMPTTGEVYCYGRNTGMTLDQYVYTKLKFRLSLRDVKCDNPDPNNNNNCLSGFYLGNPYQAQFSQPISVGECSPVLNLGSLRNQTQFGTVVSIDDVKADSTCQANGTYCPAEKIVRAGSCWHMTMQISTDYTQDLP